MVQEGCYWLKIGFVPAVGANTAGPYLGISGLWEVYDLHGHIVGP